MRKSLVFLITIFLLMMLISGCDAPFDEIVQTTSIVGRIGNVNKKDTEFVVKAYFENKPDEIISKTTADKDGYFQIVLSEASSYILKIDYIFDNKTMEYVQPYTYYEKKIEPIKVNKDKITNIGNIYTSLEDVYLEKIIQGLEREGEIKFLATVKPGDYGIYTGYDPVKTSPENRLKYQRAFGMAMRDSKFNDMYKILQENMIVKFFLEIIYL